MLEKIEINSFFMLIFFTIIFFIFGCFSFAQKTNLQIFYNLADSSVSDIISSLDNSEKEIQLTFDFGEGYSIFRNQIIADFLKHDFKVNAEGSDKPESPDNSARSDKNIIINYTLDEAKVSYDDIFRSGLLGSYYIPRKIFYSGSFLLNKNQIFVKEFQYTYQDTVLVSDVKSLENYSYPFTKAEVPSEPFFSSLFEPLVAIGTAAVAVFLFFTIRSK